MIPLAALALIRGGLAGTASALSAKAKAKSEKEAAVAEAIAEEKKRQEEFDNQIKLEQEKARLKAQYAKPTDAELELANTTKFLELASTNQDASLSSLAKLTGTTYLDPKAIFSTRSPIYDTNGQETGKYDVIQVLDTARKDPGVAVNNIISVLDGRWMDWARKNKPARYNQAVGLLTTQLVQLAQETGAKGIEGKTGDLPVLTSATVRELIDAYGEDFAEKRIRDAVPTIGKFVRKYYKEEFGVEVVKNPEVTTTPVTDPKTGETNLQVDLADNQVLSSVDNLEKGAVNNEVRQVVTPMANVVGRSNDLFIRDMEVLGQANNRSASEIINSLAETRKGFAGEQFWITDTGRPGSFGPSNVQALNKFTLDNGLFTKLSPTQSLDLIQALAGPGLQSKLYTAGPQTIVSRAQGGNVNQTVDISPEEAKEKNEKVREQVFAKYGFKGEDVQGKNQAAGDAIKNIDALIGIYQSDTFVPGVAGGVANVVVGAQQQVKYLYKLIEASSSAGDLTPAGREKALKKIKEQELKLKGLEGLEGIALTNKLKTFYEGILVYSMAMALQGGNAAARTISDADIERISNILNTTDKLATREQKIAVMQSLRSEMEFRKAIGDAVLTGDESRVWAAVTANQITVTTKYGGRSALDHLFEQHGTPVKATQEKPDVKIINGTKYYLNPETNVYSVTKPS